VFIRDGDVAEDHGYFGVRTILMKLIENRESLMIVLQSVRAIVVLGVDVTEAVVNEDELAPIGSVLVDPKSEVHGLIGVFEGQILLTVLVVGVG
jgi:hypothetical protein